MQLLWTVLAVAAAFATGRSIIIWSVLTYVFGGWMLAILVLLGPKHHVLQRRADILNVLNEHLETKIAKQKGYKDFNTVDDLMKQLETK